MKRTILLLSIFVLVQNLGYTQTDTLYVMKNGVALEKYNTVTELDSIIFYNPDIIDPPSTDVPFFDLTDIQVVIGDDISTNSPWNAVYGGRTYNTAYSYLSPLAGTWVGLEVTFPPSYNTQPNKRYPVVYHLHGHGETDTSTVGRNLFLEAQSAMINQVTPEFIYIQVGGPIQCWWSDGDDGVMAESHFINEILSFVDQTLRTLPKRGSRAVQGFSMGGWGATKIAFKYPQYFSAVGSFCGALYSYDDLNKPQQHMNGGNYGYVGNYNTIWSGIEEDYKQDNARYLAQSNPQKIIDANLNYVLCNCGPGDNFYTHNNDFDAELTALSIPHKNILKNVGHSPSAMTEQTFADLLEFIETE